MALIENVNLSEVENKQILESDDSMNDAYAARLALADFKSAEQYRSQNHDQRWQNADQLYLSWSQKKTWRAIPND